MQAIDYSTLVSKEIFSNKVFNVIMSLIRYSIDIQ